MLIHRYEGVLLAATVIVALVTAPLLGQRRRTFARSGYTLLGVLYIGKLLYVLHRDPADPATSALAATIYGDRADRADRHLRDVDRHAFGRTPLSPISPRKTVEGSVGGLVVAVLGAVAAGG